MKFILRYVYGTNFIPLTPMISIPVNVHVLYKHLLNLLNYKLEHINRKYNKTCSF